MNKKNLTIVGLIISIIIVFILVIGSTYSVIINVIDKDDGETKIVNEITIRDILTDDNGNFNNTYYQVKNELNIDYEDMNFLMDSIPLNKALQVVLDSIVSYRLHNKNRLSNYELINLIVNSVNEDDNINNELKDNVIIKTRLYIDDISYYMYDLNVSYNGVIS